MKTDVLKKHTIIFIIVEGKDGKENQERKLTVLFRPRGDNMVPKRFSCISSLSSRI